MRDESTGVDRDVSDDVVALLTDFDRLNVVLVNGRFERAHGFTLSPDRRVATLAGDAVDDADASGVVVMRLRWKRY